jgi:hypothetical protein
MKRQHLQFAAATILTLARAIGATTGSVVNAVLLEVRAGFSDDDLLRSHRAAEIGSARELAEKLKAAVIGKGRFAEIRCRGPESDERRSGGSNRNA